MERDGRNHYHTRGSGGRLLAEADPPLNWGNRKRLRRVKYHRKDDSSAPAAAAAANWNKASATPATMETAPNLRAAQADKDSNSNPVLRRTASPTRQRVLRNWEANWATAVAAGTRGNGGGRGLITSAEMGPGRVEEKKSSSSGSEGATLWPKFAIGLTNKEKEEDFWMLKGSKLPHRPKKRTKLVQKTLNLVSPGAWLCDLTLERYEVREKKISKKKPRGLKAMGNKESDSE